MADFKFQVTITYEPHNNYWTAYMNEVKMCGTGSGYQTALANCIAAASASTTDLNEYPPYNSIKTW